MTDKQERFVHEYLIDLNASAAYLRAGYKSKNPDVDGHQLLVQPSIAAAIAELQKAQLEKADLTAVGVLQEIRRVAYSDVGEVFNESGQLLRIKDLPVEVRRAIASVKVVKKNLVTGDGVMDDIHEIKLWDKMKALEMGAKHFALLTEKIDHSGDIVIKHEI